MKTKQLKAEHTCFDGDAGEQVVDLHERAQQPHQPLTNLVKNSGDLRTQPATQTQKRTHARAYANRNGMYAASRTARAIRITCTRRSKQTSEHATSTYAVWVVFAGLSDAKTAS